jgi:hypothetical protein
MQLKETLKREREDIKRVSKNSKNRTVWDDRNIVAATATTNNELSATVSGLDLINCSSFMHTRRHTAIMGRRSPFTT